MRKLILLAAAFALLAISQTVKYGGKATVGGPTNAGSTSQGSPFTLLSITANTFTANPSTLPGLPTIPTVDGNGAPCNANATGYQTAQYLSGKVIYGAWQTNCGAGGGTWTGGIALDIPNPAMMVYTPPSNNITGFSNAANWQFYDLRNLSWNGKGTTNNTPGSYMFTATIGNTIYATPNGGNAVPVLPKIGGSVFLSYDTTQSVTNPAAYQTWAPPADNTTMGQLGWCTGVCDARYCYHAPSENATDGANGNIFRYDTTLPFTSNSSWSNYDLRSPGGAWRSNAKSFQNVVYDGHRYVYFIPYFFNWLIRYDTWNGGSGLDGSGFTNAANYVEIDPTTLNSAGKPTATGLGSVANAFGYTGGVIQYDSAGNQYLYLVPWATYKGSSGNPIFTTTTVRVRIGTLISAVWSPIDMTSTSTNPAISPNWQYYDLNLLQANSSWQAGWPKTYASGSFAGQTTIGGFQLGWASTVGGINMAGFVADTSQFIVRHIVDNNLYDSAGWFVQQIPTGYKTGTMGMAFDATNNILYPAPPGGKLYAIKINN